MFDVILDPSSDVSEHSKPSVIVILVFFLPQCPCTVSDCTPCRYFGQRSCK
jgi:hypothetical protein